MEDLLKTIFFTAMGLIVAFCLIHYLYVVKFKSRDLERRKLYTKYFKRNMILFIVAALLILTTVGLALFQWYLE